MATTTKRGAIPLTYAADRVLVVPEDGDRFIMTGRQTVEACKQATRNAGQAREQRASDEELQRFEQHFLRPLHVWCEANSARVRACYIPYPAGHVEVYVVGAGTRYDIELGRDLSRLELELFDKGWRVNVVQLPRPDDDDGLRAHFDYDGALQVYAHRQSTPDQGRGEPAVPVDD